MPDTTDTPQNKATKDDTFDLGSKKLTESYAQNSQANTDIWKGKMSQDLARLRRWLQDKMGDPAGMKRIDKFFSARREGRITSRSLRVLSEHLKQNTKEAKGSLATVVDNISNLPPRLALAALLREWRNLGANEQSDNADLIFGQLVPDIIERAEASNETGEEIADVAIGALEQAVGRKEYGDTCLQILPSIRFELEGDAAAKRESGWLKSLVAIGMLASKCARLDESNTRLVKKGALAAAWYYHDTLTQYVKAPGQYSNAETVRNAANNLGASLRRLARAGDGDEDRISRIDKNLDLIVRKAEFDASSKRIDRDVLSALGFKWDGPFDSKFAVLLDGAGREANRADDGFASSHAHAVQAVIRITVKDEDHTAAAFFNAGVTLARLSNKSEYKNKTIDLVRIMLNILGAHFALELNETLAEAWVENDGSDCLVNFSGAVSSLKDTSPDDAEWLLDNGVRDLIKISQAATAHFGGALLDDATRVSASMRSLGIKELPPIGPDADSGELKSALVDLVRRARESCHQRLFDEPSPERLGPLEVAHIVRSLYLRLDGLQLPSEKGKSVENNIRKMQKSLPDDLAKMTSADLATMIRAVYGPEYAFENGPLLPSGISEPTWAEATRIYSGQTERRSLSAAFREEMSA